MQDVAVMKQRIANGANLLDAHVFQFDFLNDPLDSAKVPEDLRDVLGDAEKRKRLVIYINPSYAEAGSTFAKDSKVGVSNRSRGSTTDAKGKTRMNTESSDERYTELLVSLRTAMKRLSRRIEPKVYEYGFLKR